MFPGSIASRRASTSESTPVRMIFSAVERRLVADVPLGAFLSGGTDSSVVAGSVSYSVAGQTASFTPDSPFAPETTYVVTVDTGATDLAGNALVADAVWTALPRASRNAPIFGGTASRSSFSTFDAGTTT